MDADMHEVWSISDDDSEPEESELEESDLDEPGLAPSHTHVQSLSSWRKSFKHCLDGIKAAGNIATFHHYPKFANPGLRIASHPVIPLPLTEHHAETIIKNACRQAPFGRGDETVVDTSVRNTWELDHTQFQLANPAWEPFLGEIINDVAVGLGLEGVAVKPHKLLLYEPGSFFKRHKDSEKETGMVATLVICLPSEHQGADVHVSFGQEKSIFSTAPTSCFDVSAIAWFSDVSHEVKELVSGYRVVLTYKLFSSRHLSATQAFGQTNMIKTFLAQWLANSPQIQQLAYPLQHKYTEASVSLNNMKGRDRSVCSSLHSVCSESGFYLLFAKMSHETAEDPEGYYDDYGDDDPSTTLDNICTINGEPVASYTGIDEDEILGQGFKSGVPDSEDEGEFTGNESAPSRYRYHNTVAFLVPKRCISSYMGPSSSYSGFNNGDNKTAALVAMISRDLEQLPNHDVTKHAALQAMGIALNKGSALQAETVRLIVGWALRLNDANLWTRCLLTSVRSHNYQGAIFQALASYLTTEAKDFNWEARLQPFANASKAKDLQLLMDAGIGHLQSTPHVGAFKSWVQTALNEKIMSQTDWQTEDRPFICACLKSPRRDSTWILEKFLPLVAAQGSPDLLFAVLHEIAATRSSNEGDRPKAIYQCLINHCGNKLEPQISKLAAPTYNMTAPSHARQFITFFEEAHLIGVDTEASQLLDRACGYLSKSAWPPIQDRDTFIWEFLVPLAKVMGKNNYSPTEATREFLGIALRTVAHTVVTSKSVPKRSVGWAHKPRGCGSNCPDCLQLDAFLTSQEVTWEFKGGQGRRNHLESRLPPNIFGLQTIRTGSPHTLQVKKLGQDTEYNRQVYEFRSAICQLEHYVSSLKTEFFQGFLGEDLYRELILLKRPNGNNLWGHLHPVGSDPGTDTRPAKRMRG